MIYSQEVFNLLTKQHPNAGCELNFKTPYELLVATILSAQCTDKRVNEVTAVLFEKYNTPELILQLGLEGLKKYIFSCGFYNNKAKNIIEMSQDLIDRFNGVVPEDFDSLTSLAGVGRKTASVVSCVAFNIPAMPVDTHVFRVSRRIGLSKGRDPAEVEKDLKEQFPKEQWNTLHHTLIFHGRYVCESRKPKCEECYIKDICKKIIVK
ncbi:MAG: endonuclease III [Clostridia bacterium]|nr:endonuclease III [Clostridia bacterium]